MTSRERELTIGIALTSCRCVRVCIRVSSVCACLCVYACDREFASVCVTAYVHTGMFRSRACRDWYPLGTLSCLSCDVHRTAFKGVQEEESEWVRD